jgi:hypothetical protein
MVTVMEYWFETIEDAIAFIFAIVHVVHNLLNKSTISGSSINSFATQSICIYSLKMVGGCCQWQTSASSLSLSRDRYIWSRITATRFQVWAENINYCYSILYLHIKVLEPKCSIFFEFFVPFWN